MMLFFKGSKRIKFVVFLAVLIVASVVIYNRQKTDSIGARAGAATWIDADGEPCLFGGSVFDQTATLVRFNDLMCWDGSGWNRVSGSDEVDQAGIYGTKGISSSSNIPGARDSAVSWVDSKGDLWLFGGTGHDGAGTVGQLNDLWRWDGNNWTWMSGSMIVNQAGIYGTQGIADEANVPGVRYLATSWTDNVGNLWLFGGIGRDSNGARDKLNDLWRWDGTNWTWISGSSTRTRVASYGIKGIAAEANVPGGRMNATSWTDSSGGLWMFGGFGTSGDGASGWLNDLWHWDGRNWTWVSGSDMRMPSGVYGTKGVPEEDNVPGGRYGATSWIDASGDMWLFGGRGYDVDGTQGQLNDLWRWDGVNWTWMSGSKTIDQSGVYGVQGTADTANIPGARFGAMSWNDSGGVWLFGGVVPGDNRTLGRFNDLWRWDGTNWAWISGSNTAFITKLKRVKVPHINGIKHRM